MNLKFLKENYKLMIPIVLMVVLFLAFIVFYNISVNNKYNIMEYIENNDKFIKAMDGFDEEQKNQYLIGKNNDEKTIISLALEYKNIYELIEDGTIDEEIKEMLVEMSRKSSPFKK